MTSATTSWPAPSPRWTGTATAPIGVDTFNLGGNRAVPTGAMVEEIARALAISTPDRAAPTQLGD